MPATEAFFRVLLESTGDLIAVLGIDGTVRYASPSHQTVLGYQPEDLIGRNAFDLVHPDDRPALSERFAAGVARADATDTGEFRLRHASGGWRMLDGIGRNRLDDPSIAGIVVASRDVTERWLAEQALHEREGRLAEAHRSLEQRVAQRTTELAAAVDRLQASEQRYRELVETIHDAVYSLDADGRITYMSPVIESLAGYRPEEVFGRRFIEFVHPEDRAAATANFGRSITGVLTPIECRMQTKSGSVRWARAATRLTVRADGDRELRGVLTDVTDRRQAEDVARQREAQLAHVQRVATIGAMTAQVAHEINQPLAAIVNFADGLLLRLRDGDVGRGPTQYAARQIAAEGRRAAEVIRRLREFAGRGVLELELSDVDGPVREVLALLEPEARRRGIAVQVALAAPAPVPLDRLQIQQVIAHVLRNAFDAVAAAPAGPQSVDVASGGDGRGHVVVAVRDSGVGLPDGAEARVFDAFFTTKPDGLGVGLTISHSIIDAHGGRLWVERNLDRGTTVRLSLPIAGA